LNRTSAPIVAVVAAGILAAPLMTCGPAKLTTHALNCSNPSFQGALTQALFLEAARGVDMMAAEHAVRDAETYKAELRRLEATKPLRFTAVRFEGYDAQLQRTSCAATVRLVVPPEDRTRSANDAARRMRFPADTPGDLLGEAPETDITYSIQPSPDGHGSVVTGHEVHPTTSALAALAGIQYVEQGGD
jgi:hypothetical protein